MRETMLTLISVCTLLICGSAAAELYGFHDDVDYDAQPVSTGIAAPAIPQVIGQEHDIAPVPRYPEQRIVPVPHHGPAKIEAAVWTDRGPDSIYRQGESILVRFRVSEDAYVCVYNIDTEGHLRVLYPYYDDEDGFVRGGRVHTLPASDHEFDFVVEGPPGVEYVSIVASRHPLRLPWNAHASDWHAWESYLGGEASGQGWGEEHGYIHHDEAVYYDDIHLAWSDQGYQVQGDPFVAMRHVNTWLVPYHRRGQVASDYSRLYVGGQFAYERYACNDCHGSSSSYDPYHSSCSVFQVSVNSGWYYQPWPVTVVHRVEPRYVYVRYAHVPVRYRTVRTHWPSHRRGVLRREFRQRLAPGDVVPKSVRYQTAQGKTRSGYGWKDDGPGKTGGDYRWKSDRRRPTGNKGSVQSGSKSRAPTRVYAPPRKRGSTRLSSKNKPTEHTRIAASQSSGGSGKARVSSTRSRAGGGTSKGVVTAPKSKRPSSVKSNGNKSSKSRSIQSGGSKSSKSRSVQSGGSKSSGSKSSATKSRSSGGSSKKRR